MIIDIVSGPSDVATSLTLLRTPDREVRVRSGLLSASRSRMEKTAVAPRRRNGRGAGGPGRPVVERACFVRSALAEAGAVKRGFRLSEYRRSWVFCSCLLSSLRPGYGSLWEVRIRPFSFKCKPAKRVSLRHRTLSPGCRAVELSRLRRGTVEALSRRCRGAVEALSRPCLSSLSSYCRVPVEPVEPDSMRLGVEFCRGLSRSVE